MNDQLEKTDWSPERKIMGAAVAVVLLGLVDTFTGVAFAPGFEGGIAVIIAYFLPNKRVE